MPNCCYVRLWVLNEKRVMKKSAHQIWKEAKEQGLTKEEFKEKFPDMERCTLESPLYHNVVRYISGVR